MSLQDLKKLNALSQLTGLTRLVDLVPLYYKMINEVTLYKQSMTAQ